jgi:hypothetical protein
VRALIVIIAVTAAAVSFAVPVSASERGVVGGAVVGGTAGAIVGGPVGAVVGAGAGVVAEV